MTCNTQNLERKFETALSNLATGRGMRNCKYLPEASFYAVKLGLDESTFLDRVQNATIGLETSAIHRAYRSASRKFQPGATSPTAGHPYTYRAKTKRTYPHYVRELIYKGRAVRTLEGLSRLSPNLEALTPGEQTWSHVRRLFSNDRDYSFIFKKDPPTPGILGFSLMRVGDWLRNLQRHPSPGELVVPNPFSGLKHETSTGDLSYIGQDCLTSFPHLIIEFDDLPLEEQCAFWYGFLQGFRGGANPLVSLVYSGGKSIHGCIRIGALDLMTQQTQRAKVISMLASDPDKSYRADVESMRPRQGTRLAGVKRDSTERLQRLLWLST